MDSEVLKAAEFLQQKNLKKARIAIILGSGLGAVTDALQKENAISYSEIPFFPKSTVEGHPGEFLSAQLNDIPLYILRGRFHYYEGKSLAEVTFPVRLLKKLGVETLIVTNAAGILNRNFKPGEFMIIEDHINLIGDNPLRGRNWDDWGPRFPNLTKAYDLHYRKIAKRIAKQMALRLYEGVYVAIPGPSYETPAEVRMLQTLGADAVGMSTVPEVIVAAHQGTRVCGFSCLTNFAPGISHQKVTHEDVLATTQKASEKFSRFLQNFIIKISHE